MASLLTLGIFVSISLCLQKAFAYDNSYYDNVAVYWGQNSYGATSSNTAHYQQPISLYCEDDAIDALPVAFVTTFFGTGGLPVLNLANTCNPTNNATFPGTNLANCSALAADIEYCQSKGKIVTISLGGAGSGVGFGSDAEAQTFAHTIWNLFLGGSNNTRPFGSAVLDGVDLDIEGGGSTGYAAFVTEIRSLAAGASKPYYITAAPQCPFPDANLGSVINAVGLDAIYVQFYNNQCGLQNFNIASDWNFGVWDMWARQTSPNPNVKIYVGAPASSSAAGGGYLPIGNLSNIAVQMRKSFPSFGGVMLWDASQAYANNRYDLAIKQALSAAGSTGFTYPACSAPAYASGQAYTAGEQVSYGGYIWEAAYWTSSVPSSSGSSGWGAISACAGTSSAPATTSSSAGTTTTTSSAPTTTSSSTRTATTTSSAPTTTSSSTRTATTTSSAPTTTSSTRTATATSSTASPATTATATCSGVAAWQSGVVYTAGDKATYGGHLWTAKWWTENDAPGGSAGDWTDDGAC